MQQLLQVAHTLRHGLRRWRDEVRVSWASPRNPVLRAAERSGVLTAPTSAGEESFVDLADEAVRERESVAEPREAMVERDDVVGDLFDVVDGYAWGFLQLEEQEVGQRGLSALDLRGQHGFLPHVRVKEQVRIRQEGGDAIQAAECQERLLEPHLARAVDDERWVGRQGVGKEGADAFSPKLRARDGIAARGAPLHRCPPCATACAIQGS